MEIGVGSTTPILSPDLGEHHKAAAFYTENSAANAPQLRIPTSDALRKSSPPYGYPSTRTRHERAGPVRPTVNAFRRMSTSALSPEKREMEELALQGQSHTSPEAPFPHAGVAYWAARREKRSRRQDRRQILSSDAVRHWIIDITERVYGLKFEQANVPVWHPDVLYFDVKDASTGALVGGVYLDLYPRDGKYKHAAASSARRSSTRVGRRPISVLMTNFDRTGMTFDEVSTYFHESATSGTTSSPRRSSRSGRHEAGARLRERRRRFRRVVAAAGDARALKAMKGCPELDANGKHAGRARVRRGIEYARANISTNR